MFGRDRLKSRAKTGEAVIFQEIRDNCFNFDLPEG